MPTATVEFKRVQPELGCKAGTGTYGATSKAEAQQSPSDIRSSDIPSSDVPSGRAAEERPSLLRQPIREASSLVCNRCCCSRLSYHTECGTQTRLDGQAEGGETQRLLLQQCISKCVLQPRLQGAKKGIVSEQDRKRCC